MPTRSENERYAIADRALAQYAALEIHRALITQNRTAQYQRIRFGIRRVINSRSLNRDVILHYKRCKKDGANYSARRY